MIMSLSLGPADAVAERLGVGETLRGAAILDVGAGACAWTIPFARRDPSSRITAFDLPPVLQETAKIVQEFGVASSFRMQGGNYRTDDLGTDYDIVILGNICHIETPEANRDLTSRSCRALKRGGRLIIGDMLPNEERTGPPFPILFALQMFLNGGGDIYFWRISHMARRRRLHQRGGVRHAQVAFAGDYRNEVGSCSVSSSRMLSAG